MTALDEIQKEFMQTMPESQEDKLSLRSEIVLIATQLIYIILISFTFYYGLTYLLFYGSGGWVRMRSIILPVSFAVGAITGILVAMRGSAGALMYQASALRMAWTGKKMEENAFEFFRDFALGVKLDTIIFYGSVMVFIFTYAFT